MAGAGIDHLCSGDFVDLGDHLLEDADGPLIHFLFVFVDVLLENLLLLVGHVHTAAEPLGCDDDALFTGGHFEGIVFHVFTGAAEDRVQQFFFGGQFAFALGGNLADKYIAGADTGADSDDAGFIQIRQGTFGDVGDVAGEFLAAKLGLANFDIVFLDVDGGEDIFLHETLTDDDGVLKVVAVESEECDQHIAAQRQFALMGGCAVGDDLALLHALAFFHDRLLVEAGALVEADEFAEDVFIRVVDENARRVHIGDDACAFGADDHAAVLGDGSFHAGADDRGIGAQQRNGLALHVAAHQGAIGVVVFEEGNQRGRNGDRLTRADIDVLNVATGHGCKVALNTGQDQTLAKLAVFFDDVRRSEDGLHLFIGAEVFVLAVDLSILHNSVWGDEESVLIDVAVNRQRSDETDVRAFRSFDRADSAVVGNMNVADFEAGAFAI